MPVLHDIDPATGETIAEVPVTTPEELQRLVAAARAAQPAWAEVPLEARAGLLVEGARALGENADELAHLVTREMGKPLEDARREVAGYASAVAREMEEVAEALAVEEIGSGLGTTVVERVPLGVVAAISPWNFPLGMPINLMLPALATGNTVVLKPSEQTPLCGAAVAEAFGGPLPDGVLGLAQGGGDVGAALVASDVDMIAFTGSRETGQHIMKSASDGLKRLVLELGGKDPLVVFADADLEAAAKCAVDQSLRNTGQVCCSLERVYVADEVAEEFERLVVERARTWRHGLGTDPEVKMGPLVSAVQRDKVAAQVADAVAGGARLLLGGEVPEGEGWFYPATVLADVDPDLTIARGETFGPVVCLMRFSGDEEDGVRLANDTEFGLGANVYTRDLEKGRRVARRIQAGQVGVNRYLTAAPGAPWVGHKGSGFGFVGGVHGHRQFTIPRSIRVEG
jgi:acyl-CoA reductase-like NAD-dependent aldehyde dehydrogenase